MDLTKYHSFHFIGIGGMGMRALAVILLDKGERISVSDVADSPFLRDFRKKGAEIYIGHEASHVKGADCVVISSAISEENPELLEARRLGIPVFHRSDVLAAMFHWGKGIAVAGAHGKSTTSAMVGQIFYEAGKDPTIVLGAAASYIGGNSCLGKGEYVIAEADESDGSFLKFSIWIIMAASKISAVHSLNLSAISAMRMASPSYAQTAKASARSCPRSIRPASPMASMKKQTIGP